MLAEVKRTMLGAVAAATPTKANKETVRWPGGKRFAFTIIDDTDWASVQNVGPVYDLLNDLGMRSTKSVWVLPGDGDSNNAGQTCADQEYLDWTLELQRQGFEIAIHNASPATSSRRQTKAALTMFRRIYGVDPMIHCNHVGCEENLYWGDSRLSGWRRTAYNVMTRGRRRNRSRGHIPNDELFWGDLCREHVRYVRNFVFNPLNTLKACPDMPYHDPSRPFVRFWFASSNGGTLDRFVGNVTPRSIEALAAEGGLCILYTHFARGFAANGRPHPKFRATMERLARLDGWFPTVTEALDHLRLNSTERDREISPARLARLESKWLLERVRYGEIL
jgi:hypothetical protein